MRLIRLTNFLKISPKDSDFLVNPIEILDLYSSEKIKKSDSQILSVLMFEFWNIKKVTNKWYEIRTERFNFSSKRNNSRKDRLRQSIKRLENAYIKTEVLDENNNKVIEKVNIFEKTDLSQEATLRYRFSSDFIKVMKSSSRSFYTRKSIVSKLKYRSSFPFYNWAESRFRHPTRTETITPETLRHILNVQNNTLNKWADLKRVALTNSLEEVNRLSDHILTYETITPRRSVVRIKFSWAKKSLGGLEQAEMERAS